VKIPRVNHLAFADPLPIAAFFALGIGGSGDPDKSNHVIVHNHSDYTAIVGYLVWRFDSP
jgi:hypothetical protein